ncbi:tRNA-Thr(GGU) m(6)t(6)A37 methyltransferase TsaA [Allopseudospirillum japonicum]|uniref:tRNA-Thr(GGU) m(6)t(6)A37 methyltransferase TsaA n=1 Tax=Allopseudospirillum japonicum TaxID=64971 RepID=A0A1H6TZH9_9GAMM|nr:tRNA (N6-threonylcarbamoyladenosine(37)-N6)-methyltransferase TrmO [Allopseudospirillum japonicum]SEI81152.1 tRNA-Thr(GGU) m(6)t(6)A37 methyltransferase TsaA [Allopseudospirillum japonicum]
MSSSTLPNSYTFQPIGIIESPYQEKFGVPRQANLVAAKSRIRLLAPYNTPDALQGLTEFSHLWLHFVFHLCLRQTWKPKVRPPRLGGNQSLGVFATRSSFRPNPIGLSLVRLESIHTDQQDIYIEIRGADLVAGTPILDIKPYLPYADIQPQAHAATWAQEAPDPLNVHWTPEALANLQVVEEMQNLYELITQVLAQDPRPAYHHKTDPHRVYGVKLSGYNVNFCYRNSEQAPFGAPRPCIWVLAIKPL